jgi:hypothetical protein
VLAKVGLCCSVNGKYLLIMQGTFCVSEFYVIKLIVLFETCRYTKPKSHGLRSAVLDVHFISWDQDGCKHNRQLLTQQYPILHVKPMKNQFHNTS